MNLAHETIIIGGQTAKKKLIIALAGGFLFLASLLAIFGITGVAYAVPLAGVGEFTVKFDEMVGQGFKLYGGIADGGTKQGNVVAVNEIDHATIKGLVISKEFKALGFRVNISSTSDTPVEIDGLVQKATVVTGDASFSDLTMKENYVGNETNPLVAASKEFTQDAGTITIKKGVLDTLYLFQKTVSLPNMKVSFETLQ